ncbi:MAG TPA: ATP-dependent DNA helicase [Woeseiaceae bacterium]|nr:ATP-dependent DNA helicase [Woeseiaceae bacterium]
MTRLADFFAAQSPLTELLPGYQPRAGQAWMAEAVEETIQNFGKLIVEAGTGTGKTFAYLLPAMESGRKTIISTGTKALQDQLFHRDLPLLCKAVGRPVTAALLKGRANYLCLHRLEQIDNVAPTLGDNLHAVQQWRYRTVSGDRAELDDVAEDSAIWPLVTSTAENCLGQQCPQYSECHVVKARRAAQEAELVVVNHHLLLADLAMKEEGFVEFLPGAEAIILDEAHQIPDLAVQFFGVGLGSRELERLVDEIRAATLPFTHTELNRRIDRMQQAIRVLRSLAPRKDGRHELAELLPTLREPFNELRTAMAELAAALQDHIDSAVDIEKLAQQLHIAGERLALLVSDDAWDGLRWLEVNPRSIRINLTPLDVSGKLAGMIDNTHQAWVFTSATLAVGEDFSHFTSRMGLHNARTLTFPSPYAMEKHGLVYLPSGLPQPAEFGYTEEVLEGITPMFRLTAGGVFFLFTSHRALNIAATWFRTHKKVLGGRKLLTQGSVPRDELLRRFRTAGNGVLLGTSSFWEGVDVRGRALTLVVIDKLPFGSPADPLMMARLEFIRRNGGNGFFEHQVPQAVLTLKQGAGRLLRDQHDYGVVVLCDPRIRSKGYGKMFLQAIEPMPVTTSMADVAAFYAGHEGKGDVA